MTRRCTSSTDCSSPALAPITDATAPEQALTKSLVDEKALDRLGKAVQGLRRRAARYVSGTGPAAHAPDQRPHPSRPATLDGRRRALLGAHAPAHRRYSAARYSRTTVTDPQELGEIAVEPLLDALDALADTATFETTHRLLGGDRSAAGTVLASVDRGEAPPPALNSLDTPRGGVTVAHRVVLLLPASTSGGGWTSAASAAAMAEPRLERWAASVLGAPDQIRLVVERHDATTGALIRRDRAHLAELVQLSALDFSRLAADGPWQDGPLAARVRVALDVAGQRIVLADDAPLGPGQIGLSEAHAIAASLASSWRGGRSATPAELSPLRAPNESLRALDRLELSGRLESLKEWLDRQGLTLASVAQAERPALLGCFRQLIAFGVPALAPPIDVLDESVEQLRERLPALEAARAAIALAVTTALTALTKPGDDAVALKEVTVGLSGIVGDVPVLPLYKAGAGAARSPLGTVLPTDEATISGWFAQLARVRPRIDAFDAALRLAEVRHERPPFTLCSGQPGASQDDAWAAIHRPPGDRPCLCITAVLAGGVDPGEDLAAVAVDAWSERVPAREVLGGLALQIQSPAAQAPQVVLLATPAPGVDHWSLAELQRAAASASRSPRSVASHPTDSRSSGICSPASSSTAHGSRSTPVAGAPLTSSPPTRPSSPTADPGAAMPPLSQIIVSPFST
ncbi:hypothetical protein [Nannocystis sp.]|uniref:hypothetical protein n=1 Tax=Nannocystis sp. TaxID=1962667 RepID=UPI0025CF7D34|nr:hypothetical protein [Nannocystis sp.]MBK7828401.1 hypothetical protein [Nannocystis sp.]